jgi:uncharacterized protein (DUF1800 family)
MGVDLKSQKPDMVWDLYAPTTAEPWNLRRVVHLHRRAGFAATWREVQRDLKDGPEKSVGRLLAGTARTEGMPADFEDRAGRLAQAAVASRSPQRLKAWWVYRMLFGPDPLGERLALLWHNHFATSNLKVDDLAAMRRQNELFREHARGKFGELLRAVVKSPALLVWLDADVNRKGRPNENLGRELMELFTLGVGNYTEQDVKDASRCLTGWTVKDERFHEDLAQHDTGEKTVLGRRGKWRGDDLLDMLLGQAAMARRLAWRLCDTFLAPGAIGREEVEALATRLQKRQLDIGWGVGTLLRSRAFFAERNIGGRILGPTEHVVGTTTALELFDPSPSTLALADWAARLGQDLFYPPNVFGWPGGRSWINPRTALQRTRYAEALVEGRAVGRTALDAAGLARRHGQGKDLEEMLGFYLRLLLGLELTPQWQQRLMKGLGARPSAERAVALILSTPEAQLG